MILMASSYNDGLVIETENERDTKLLFSIMEFVSRYNDIHNDGRISDTEIEFASKLAKELHTYLVDEDWEVTE